jgi:hypothetical protein
MSSQLELGLADQNQQETLGEVWQGEAHEDPLPDSFGDQPQRNVFPEVMVGVWEVMVNEYSGSKWGIKFEPDGSISKIIHHVAGPVRLTEGGVHAEGAEEGTYYFFIMGPCEARYTPETRMLKVKIVVDYFEMKLPAGMLEGRIEDYFWGAVSEDGESWKVEWLNYGWVKGATPPPFDVIEAHPIPLVFTKLDLTQIRQEDDAQ